VSRLPYTTSQKDVNALLVDLLAGQRRVLGEDLVGLYLYGSLVSGDFDREISDIDLLAVTRRDVDQPTFEELRAVHSDVLARFEFWRWRLEVAYLSRQALRTFRTERSPIAVVSPGEPFHIKDAGHEWLINWWVVRNQAKTLYGPPPETLIAPISTDEFRQEVRSHTHEWTEWIEESSERPGQAYAILTLCRALYAWTNGEQVSKRQAAEWAIVAYPQQADVIRQAIQWRIDYRDQDVDHAASHAIARAFCRWALQEIG